VFSEETKNDLNKLLQTAEDIIGSASPDARRRLIFSLENLIDRMNREAQLGG
jgi:hypothetical protein